jgi:hypothetical protein
MDNKDDRFSNTRVMETIVTIFAAITMLSLFMKIMFF